MLLFTEVSYMTPGNQELRNFLRLFVPEESLFLRPRKQYTDFPYVTLKCCCLPEAIMLVTLFVYTIDEIPDFFFSNLEPGAQLKLKHARYSLKADKTLNSDNASRYLRPVADKSQSMIINQ